MDGYFKFAIILETKIKSLNILYLITLYLYVSLIIETQLQYNILEKITMLALKLPNNK